MRSSSAISPGCGRHGLSSLRHALAVIALCVVARATLAGDGDGFSMLDEAVTMPIAPLAQPTDHALVSGTLPADRMPDVDEAVAPRAVVGLPTLAQQSSSQLQLQPNVSVNYSTDVAQPVARPRASMFLSRAAEEQAAAPHRSPFQPASRRSQAPPPAGAGADELPPPIPRPPAAPQAESVEPWILDDEAASEESFLWRLRQRAAREGEVLDLEILDDRVLQAQPYDTALESRFAGDSILDRPILEHDLLASSLHSGKSQRRTIRGFAGLLRTGVDRVWSTRQRVDAGLGLLMVEHAPMLLDTTQPLNQVRFRGDFGYGIGFPDRSEYFWASPLRGPGYQGEIDYREFAFMFEIGGDAISVQTEIPVRGYSPQFGDGHTAVGDIQITQKARLVNTDSVQVTQMLRVHTPTGNTSLGAGTGHVSMEPGGLFRLKYSDWTYLHAELKYWLPIGGDPIASGDVLSYGFGVSTVWYETLTTALMPTLELTSVNFLTGRKTGLLGPERVSRDATAALHPGVRYAWDPGSGLGAMELGVSTGLAISRDRFYDSLLRLELRFIH